MSIPSDTCLDKRCILPTSYPRLFDMLLKSISSMINKLRFPCRYVIKDHKKKLIKTNVFNCWKTSLGSQSVIRRFDQLKSLLSGDGFTCTRFCFCLPQLTKLNVTQLKKTHLTESILSTSPTHFHGMEKNPNHNVEKLLEGS